MTVLREKQWKVGSWGEKSKTERNWNPEAYKRGLGRSEETGREAGSEAEDLQLPLAGVRDFPWSGFLA